jgi:hypothetical protein
MLNSIKEFIDFVINNWHFCLFLATLTTVGVGIIGYALWCMAVDSGFLES